MLINALRGHCGEFGMVVARLPALAREALGSLVEQLRMAQTQILDLEKQLKAWHRTNEASQRLEAIPGVGVITATALVATTAMPRSSTPGVNLPLGWAWFQDSIPAAARRGSGAYPSAETAISVAF